MITTVLETVVVTAPETPVEIEVPAYAVTTGDVVYVRALDEFVPVASTRFSPATQTYLFRLNSGTPGDHVVFSAEAPVRLEVAA